MRLDLRSSLVILGTAWLLQVHVFTKPAFSQSSAPAPGGAQTAQRNLEPRSQARSQSEDEKTLAVQRYIYSEEIEALRWEEIRAQQAIEKGKKPAPERRYRTLLKPDEEHVLRDVLLDASHRIDELDRQFMILNDEIHEHYSAELAARRDALDPQRLQILDDAVRELKSSLGPDAFDKFNHYLFEAAESSGRIKTTPHQNSENN